MKRISIKITSDGNDTAVKRMSVEAEHVETAAAELIVWIAQRYRGRWQAQLGMIAAALGIKQAPVTVPVDEIDQARKRAQAAYAALVGSVESMTRGRSRQIIDAIVPTGAFGADARGWYPFSPTAAALAEHRAKRDALKRELDTCASCGGDLTKPWQAGGGHSQECLFTTDAGERRGPVVEARRAQARAIVGDALRKRSGIEANSCDAYAVGIVADLAAGGLL